MPRPGPRMEQVAVRLDAETIAALDEIAAYADTDRSTVLRNLIREYVQRELRH